MIVRLSQGGRDDRGTSLAELLTSIVLFAIVGGIVTTAITVTARTSRATQTRSSDLSAAQLALDAMSNLIQTAAQPPAVVGVAPVAAVISASSDDLGFYGYGHPGAPPEKIEFAVRGGVLTETITPSTNTGPGACKPPYSYGAASSRVLATGVSMTTPVFTYFGQPTVAAPTPTPMPLVGSPPTLPPTVVQTPASNQGLSAVELVRIVLNVDQSSNPAVAPTGATITVALPNHLVSSVPGSAC
ncbi:MAG TPA: hypothetical protein VHW74_16745 [Mycobacteriales bacterium]|nr:hypothetical protein [Mycobacteriales bacterium]